MKNRVVLLLWGVAACGEGVDAVPPDPDPDSAPQVADVAPPDADLVNVPRFSTTTHLDLTQVERISKFRSGVGHDFSDSFESCRSMKHYLCPTNCLGSNWPPPGSHVPSWTTIVVRSPVSGTVVRVEMEQSFGSQIHVRPEDHLDFRVRIFHVTPGEGIVEGAVVAAGQPLGTHASDLTMSDIAVERFLPDGLRALSFFDTLTDEAFAALQARGIGTRDKLTIEAAARDLDPLNCDGERFDTAGTLENWAVLAP